MAEPAVTGRSLLQKPSCPNMPPLPTTKRTYTSVKIKRAAERMRRTTGLRHRLIINLVVFYFPRRSRIRARRTAEAGLMYRPA